MIYFMSIALFPTFNRWFLFARKSHPRSVQHERKVKQLKGGNKLCTFNLQIVYHIFKTNTTPKLIDSRKRMQGWYSFEENTRIIIIILKYNISVKQKP